MHIQTKVQHFSVESYFNSFTDRFCTVAWKIVNFSFLRSVFYVKTRLILFKNDFLLKTCDQKNNFCWRRYLMTYFWSTSFSEFCPKFVIAKFEWMPCVENLFSGNQSMIKMILWIEYTTRNCIVKNTFWIKCKYLM